MGEYSTEASESQQAVEGWKQDVFCSYVTGLP